tara:strand:- start:505 stop:708 length:204 start_codon:yes stop_codon:yes gene_type:complete
MTYGDLLKELATLDDSQLNDKVVVYRPESDHYVRVDGVGVAASGREQFEIVTESGWSLNSDQVVLVT